MTADQPTAPAGPSMLGSPAPSHRRGPGGGRPSGSQLPSPTAHVLPPAGITAQVGVQRGLQVGLQDPGSSCRSCSPLPSSRGGGEGAPHSDGWKPSCSWAVPRGRPLATRWVTFRAEDWSGERAAWEAWHSGWATSSRGTGGGAGQAQGTRRVRGARMEPARRLRGTAGRCQRQLGRQVPGDPGDRT